MINEISSLRRCSPISRQHESLITSMYSKGNCNIISIWIILVSVNSISRSTINNQLESETIASCLFEIEDLSNWVVKSLVISEKCCLRVSLWCPSATAGNSANRRRYDEAITTVYLSLSAQLASHVNLHFQARKATTWKSKQQITMIWIYGSVRLLLTALWFFFTATHSEFIMRTADKNLRDFGEQKKGSPGRRAYCDLNETFPSRVMDIPDEIQIAIRFMLILQPTQSWWKRLTHK